MARVDDCRRMRPDVSATLEAKRAWRNRNLERERERRRSYRLTCPDCGGEMSGGNGHEKDPRRCLACHAKAREPGHGTLSRYTSKVWRCRCTDCRAANAEWQRERRRRLSTGLSTPVSNTPK